MIFGFDIGGTSIRSAVVRSSSAIGPVARVATPTSDFAAFAAALKTMIAASPTPPEAVAISLAGVIDPKTRKANCANIPCIHGRRIEHDLGAALKLQVLIANDADCFAVAEARIGAGRGHRIVFGAILGTGVGGGLVVDGGLINADGGFAGEWGHAPIVARYAGNPPRELPLFRCGCGLEGCLETLGSARGLERLDSHFHSRHLAAEEIVAASLQGDQKAAQTIDWFIDITSAPLAMVVNVTGATIVPTGGGLSRAPSLLEKLDQAVRSRTLRRFPDRLIVPSLCAHEPGIIGAALLAGVDEKA